MEHETLNIDSTSLYYRSMERSWSLESSAVSTYAMKRLAASSAWEPARCEMRSRGTPANQRVEAVEVKPPRDGSGWPEWRRPVREVDGKVVVQPAKVWGWVVTSGVVGDAGGDEEAAAAYHRRF